MTMNDLGLTTCKARWDALTDDEQAAQYDIFLDRLEVGHAEWGSYLGALDAGVTAGHPHHLYIFSRFRRGESCLRAQELEDLRILSTEPEVDHLGVYEIRFPWD